MKRFLLGFFATLLAISAESETIILDIPDEATFLNDWTVIDANGDGGDNQWKYDDEDAIYK